MERVKQLTLTHISQIEFDDIKDKLEELNTQLPTSDQMSEMQRCDHYLKLIYQLNTPTVRECLRR